MEKTVFQLAERTFVRDINDVLAVNGEFLITNLNSSNSSNKPRRLYKVKHGEFHWVTSKMFRFTCHLRGDVGLCVRCEASCDV